MGREILISADEYEKRVAILNDKILDEFFIERASGQTCVGNIYKGRVESIVRGMEAAFVDLGLEKNGFLYVSDIVGRNEEFEQLWMGDELSPDEAFIPVEHNIDDLLKKGQEIIVQIVKEPFGTKGPRLTTQVSLPGRFIVFMPFGKHRGISKRIEDETERLRLRTILKELSLPQGAGIIVRTFGVGASKKDFERELRYLVSKWQRIKFKMMRSRAPSLLHIEEDVVARMVRDNLSMDTERLLVDSKFEYKKILYLVNSYMPQLRAKVHLYSADISLFEKHGVNAQIEKVYDRRVDLKKGGYIVIEKTEGLVTIDVNSGGYTKSKKLEDTAFVVNQEAAKEIPRQLRLRDIGGIIVVDFIDMENYDHRKKIMQILKKELENDKAKTNVMPLSGLGLLEMSRQRIRRGAESISHQVCPYCAGKGNIKSELTITIEVMRKIIDFVKKYGSRNITVCVNPAVSLKLLNEYKKDFQILEKKLHSRITVTSNPAQHIEDINIK